MPEFFVPGPAGAAGAAGTASIIVNDEGSGIGTATVLNFAGAGVAATFSNGTATATISGGALSSGTAFPGGPATSDIFYRTDLNILFFYNGTRWLSTTLYHDELTNSAAALSATGSIGNWTPWHTTYDLWMEDFWSSTDVQTTNDGSKFWTIEVRKYQSNFSTNTLIASRSTGAGPDTASTMVTAKTAIGALYTPSTFPIIQVGAVKTSTPGNLFGAYALTYRLVGA